MGRGLSFAVGEFYHIYNRGTEKRRVFCDNHDYKRFLALLYLCNQNQRVELTKSGIATALKTTRTGQPLVHIVSYCLMPNHFHLLLRENIEGGISLYMQKVTTAYTMYFNKRNARTGSLFESSFKSKYIHDDLYLKYLIAYVHLNPVKLKEPSWKKDGIRNLEQARLYLDHYTYSSYQDYCGITRNENVIIEKTALPEYFETPKDFKTSVTEWLSYNSIPEEV